MHTRSVRGSSRHGARCTNHVRASVHGSRTTVGGFIWEGPLGLGRLAERQRRAHVDFDEADVPAAQVAPPERVCTNSGDLVARRSASHWPPPTAAAAAATRFAAAAAAPRAPSVRVKRDVGRMARGIARRSAVGWDDTHPHACDHTQVVAPPMLQPLVTPAAAKRRRQLAVVVAAVRDLAQGAEEIALLAVDLRDEVRFGALRDTRVMRIRRHHVETPLQIVGAAQRATSDTTAPSAKGSLACHRMRHVGPRVRSPAPECTPRLTTPRWRPHHTRASRRCGNAGATVKRPKRCGTPHGQLGSRDRPSLVARRRVATPLASAQTIAAAWSRANDSARAATGCDSPGAHIARARAHNNRAPCDPTAGYGSCAYRVHACRMYISRSA